jgi:hypothetical protein
VRTLARAALVALLLGLATAASAQVITGGVRFNLAPELVAEVSVESPAFDLLGIRTGGVIKANARTDFEDAQATVQAGIMLTLLPDASEWGLSLQVLTRVLFSTREDTRIGPEVGLALYRAF